MSLPAPVLDPPFNITRVSHVVLTGRDLDASRRFYSEVLLLVVSDGDKDALYLRGLEEAGHHSLVIRNSADTTDGLTHRLNSARGWILCRG